MVSSFPQRAAPIPVLPVDVTTVFQQVVRDGHIVVGDGHQQGPDSVGLFRIDVRAGRDQALRNLDMIVTCGIEQRRHATARRLTAPAVGWHATADDAHAVAEARHGIRFDEGRRLAHMGGHVGIRTTGEQSGNDVRMTSARGEHQRGLSVVRIADVHVRRVLEQLLHRCEHADLCGHHQMGLAARFGMVRVGAGLEQQADHFTDCRSRWRCSAG